MEKMTLPLAMYPAMVTDLAARHRLPTLRSSFAVLHQLHYDEMIEMMGSTLSQIAFETDPRTVFWKA